MRDVVVLQHGPHSLHPKLQDPSINYKMRCLFPTTQPLNDSQGPSDFFKVMAFGPFVKRPLKRMSSPCVLTTL